MKHLLTLGRALTDQEVFWKELKSGSIIVVFNVVPLAGDSFLYIRGRGHLLVLRRTLGSTWSHRGLVVLAELDSSSTPDTFFILMTLILFLLDLAAGNLKTTERIFESLIKRIFFSSWTGTKE
jgi:hypothetical protein